jgi:hypothetical protein
MRTCPCGIESLVHVHIDADLACEGIEKWKMVRIDKCVAPIVKALQKGGFNMRGSCCGHGKGPGRIDLSDGRILLIQNGGEKYLAEL